MRILITGAAGNLGGRLCDILQEQHEVFGADIVKVKNIDSLDITNFDAVRTMVADKQPDIILHPAAWTDVDGCARQPEKALAINGYGAQNVALAAAEIGAAILHISSNEVFDGKNTTPYLEYDNTEAVNQYGHSK